MFQNLGFNDINIFEEVSFQINDILISSTEKDLYLYTYGKMLCLKFCSHLASRGIFFFIF